MNYYNEIKNELINNEINRRVKNYSINRSDLNTYYNVGKILSEAGNHYGEGIIKEYSKRLTIDLGKGYGISNLKRMRQFYWKVEKGATLWHQLSWSHYRLLITLDNIDEINYYSNIAVNNLYSVRKLDEKIKSREYKRLPLDIRNKINHNEEINVLGLVKNPLMIRKSDNSEIVSEKVLQKFILEDIEYFLEEFYSEIK